MSTATLTKAKNCLSEGKVLVLAASRKEGVFAVQGSATEPYIVTATHSWLCNCPAYNECYHIQACKLIYKMSDNAVKLFDSNDEYNNLFVKADPQQFLEYQD